MLCLFHFKVCEFHMIRDERGKVFWTKKLPSPLPIWVSRERGLPFPSCKKAASKKKRSFFLFAAKKSFLQPQPPSPFVKQKGRNSPKSSPPFLLPLSPLFPVSAVCPETSTPSSVNEPRDNFHQSCQKPYLLYIPHCT